MTIMSDKLIVALDVDDLNAAKSLVDKLYQTVKIFKIGSQLFTAAGPDAVKLVAVKGAKVFLDLKFHDIPNTVANAVKAATRLGVYMLNLHVQGGSEMMRRAVSAASEEAARMKREKPIVLGVTVLTSMGDKDLKDLEIRKGMKSQVTYLAKLAKEAGLDGVVASAEEIQAVRWTCGDEFLIVTPGIRPEWSEKQDQKRTATPKEAISAGANFIVVGRPIIGAADPVEAARRISEEIG